MLVAPRRTQQVPGAHIVPERGPLRMYATTDQAQKKMGKGAKEKGQGDDSVDEGE